jgi:DNA-binding NarL/FixJ family response regulator/DNA-binding SARP family transcriptional activator/class 3 adenylate cyclase
MDFCILGPLEVLDEGRAVTLGGTKHRALLALFLVHANETLTTDRLIDELWGESPPANAAKTVQMQISRLRKALAAAGGDLIVTRGRGYELRLDPERLDSHRFERLTSVGTGELAAGRPDTAAEAFERALALWRDAPLADLSYEPFAQNEIARLEDLRAAALEQLVEAKLALGRHAEVIAKLETLIAEYPYRERLRAQLMLALYRCERQADALQAYQDARRQLVEELGIEPDERLRELERAILAQEPVLRAPALSLGVGGGWPDAAGGEGVAPAPDELPTGVVTFLLTDVEGSSRLWELDSEAMASALELHDQLIEESVNAHGGRLLKAKGEGDATLSVFRRASDAVGCAMELQPALVGASWPGGLDLSVRIALHTGEAHEREGDYFGPALNRAARLRGLTRGGTTLASQATAEIVQDHLPRGVALTDLGPQQLRGLSRQERVFELRPVAVPRQGVETGALPEPHAIRIVLAEDNYLVREGIRRLLETQPELELVASCGDLDSLLAAVEAKKPDVVLTDIRMPPDRLDEGIRAAQRLRETRPEVGVVVLSQYSEPRYALALLEGGSERRAYLLKERVDDLEQLVSALGVVAAGGSVIDPKVVEALVAAKASAERSPVSGLTPREREVLGEMAEGKNNAAIAESLVITERSVEKYVHSIFAKLGLAWEENVHRRVKAVLLFLGEEEG